MEYEKQAQRLESEADALERASERVGEHIDDVRADWEAKEKDASVPGAQPDPGEAEESVAGVETDPRELRAGRAMSGEEPRQESDQLPEEGPAGQVPDDAPGRARERAERNPGTPSEPGTATGNPGAAGAREPDEGG